MKRPACAFALAFLALATVALAQPRPYIGYVYPAGGQQGTTVPIRVGGQYLDDVRGVVVTGSGVTAKVVENYRRLNNQEVQLLNEQLRELKKATSAVSKARAPKKSAEPAMVMMEAGPPKDASIKAPKANMALIADIERRTREFVATPACASIASLVLVEVTIAADAAPGEREIRLVTLKGVSNPLPFHVGQLPEHSRKPMITSTKQVLGKEEQALRKRPDDEVEAHVTVPCTLNGQIASGEVNRYRFAARQGQRLVISTLARELVPYIADAVPGWFQPVLTLHDTQGQEVAFADDYRFRPDPVMLFQVPKDGEYVLTITDAIYRGREDFVYRISMGDLPFITSLFPLGAKVGAAVMPKMKGWNLEEATLTSPTAGAARGIQTLTASRKGLISNPVPFARDTLPEGFDKETNNAPATAQKVTLPIILNGRIDQPDDWDVFQFTGKSNDLIAVEVVARRLDSPLDSVVKLTTAAGKVLAFSDDREDLGTGLNTHHADSWFMVRLPATGTYFVHIGDTARKGGAEYAYRLRISPPQPDFELRLAPSSVALRSKSSAVVSVYAARKDGFAGPIKLTLEDPPKGFSATPVNLAANQVVTRLAIKTDQVAIDEPVALTVVGSAKLGTNEIVRAAVPAEDRMQAFLWRHLVPACDLKALVYDPAYQPPPQRALPQLPPPATTNAVASASNAAAKPKFSKSQVASRLRQLKLLYEEGLLTDGFYCEKVAECEAVQ